MTPQHILRLIVMLLPLDNDLKNESVNTKTKVTLNVGIGYLLATVGKLVASFLGEAWLATLDVTVGSISCY
jgi:hypothetical protein